MNSGSTAFRVLAISPAFARLDDCADSNAPDNEIGRFLRKTRRKTVFVADYRKIRLPSVCDEPADPVRLSAFRTINASTRCIEDFWKITSKTVSVYRLCLPSSGDRSLKRHVKALRYLLLSVFANGGFPIFSCCATHSYVTPIRCILPRCQIVHVYSRAPIII